MERYTMNSNPQSRELMIAELADIEEVYETLLNTSTCVCIKINEDDHMVTFLYREDNKIKLFHLFFIISHNLYNNIDIQEDTIEFEIPKNTDELIDIAKIAMDRSKIIYFLNSKRKETM